MATADGDEATAGDGFGEEFAAAERADLMAFGEGERGVAGLHGAGTAHDVRAAARGPRIAQERDFGVGQLELHRATGRIIPARNIPTLPF